MPEAPSRGVMIVLAYLWPLALVPFFLEKDDAEVRWHARHGLVLMAAEAAAAAVFVVLAVFASVAALWLGTLLIVVMVSFWFAVFGAHALAAIKGLGGSRLIIPGISRYADRF